jgi:hypothetical protein
MKIAMHTYDICLRGAPTANFKYSHFLEKAGHEIIIIYDKNNVFNDQEGLNKFNKRFRVFGYESWEDVEEILKNENVDLLYMLKGGEDDGKVAKEIPTAIHAIFQHKQPHGEKYAYVSKWLAEHMPGKNEYVPHIVDLPIANGKDVLEFRNKLGIPAEAKVFGRIGGYKEFSLPFVKQVVTKVAYENSHIYFLFVCTEKFCDLPNVIHVDKISEDYEKSCFIQSCDAMLHARHMGESFGLAIAEFLFHNKPVVAWSTGIDKNHLHMLGDVGIYYSSPQQLEQILLSDLPKRDYKSRVEEFSPKRVMEKFEKVFLNDI